MRKMNKNSWNAREWIKHSNEMRCKILNLYHLLLLFVFCWFIWVSFFWLHLRLQNIFKRKADKGNPICFSCRTLSLHIKMSTFFFSISHSLSFPLKKVFVFIISIFFGYARTLFFLQTYASIKFICILSNTNLNNNYHYCVVVV